MKEINLQEPCGIRITGWDEGVPPETIRADSFEDAWLKAQKMAFEKLENTSEDNGCFIGYFSNKNNGTIVLSDDLNNRFFYYDIVKLGEGSENKKEIMEETRDVLNHMVSGHDYRETSDGMAEKLFPYVYQIIEDDLMGQDVETGRLTVTKEMVVTAMMLYINN